MYVGTSYLHSAAVTLFSRLQEGVATHWSTIDAIRSWNIQQTSRVNVLQEPPELLLTTAAEQLRELDAGRREEEFI